MELYWQKTSCIQTNELDITISTAHKTIDELKSLTKNLTTFNILDPQLIKTPLSALLLPHDKTYCNAIINAARQQAALNPEVILLIGIGGSNLGTCAVHATLKQNHKSPLFYCADTIGGDSTTELLKTIEEHLIDKKRMQIILISKSGTTLETAINGALFIKLLKKYHPTSYTHLITVITDRNSPLWQSAQENHYLTLEIPPQVGGRYSVFSAVGLFPLALMGFDIEKLCEGAADELSTTLENPINNRAATSASILWLLYQQGFFVHDTFLFDSTCELLGKWYRQLVAESLGKRNSRATSNTEIGPHPTNFNPTGILPTVSIGTVDLHSLFQFYIGGPRRIVTTFVQVKQNNQTLSVPASDDKLPTTGIPIAHVVEALCQSVQQVYTDDNRPFMTISLEKTAYDLGAFMQMKMIETVLLGELLNVNPFDQPEVEKYKEKARLLLKL